MEESDRASQPALQIRRPSRITKKEVDEQKKAKLSGAEFDEERVPPLRGNEIFNNEKPKDIDVRLE